jgi:hypothetical protein
MKDLVKRVLTICAIVGSFGGGAYVVSSGVDCEVSKRIDQAVDKTLSVPLPVEGGAK